MGREMGLDDVIRTLAQAIVRVVNFHHLEVDRDVLDIAQGRCTVAHYEFPPSGARLAERLLAKVGPAKGEPQIEFVPGRWVESLTIKGSKGVVLFHSEEGLYHIEPIAGDWCHWDGVVQVHPKNLSPCAPIPTDEMKRWPGEEVKVIDQPAGANGVPYAISDPANSQHMRRSCVGRVVSITTPTVKPGVSDEKPMMLVEFSDGDSGYFWPWNVKKLERVVGVA